MDFKYRKLGIYCQETDNQRMSSWYVWFAFRFMEARAWQELKMTLGLRRSFLLHYGHKIFDKKI